MTFNNWQLKVRVFWTIWALGYHKPAWGREFQVFIGPLVFTWFK